MSCASRSLGSFGFYVDNDGVIYDITGPFDEEQQSPAWNAGIRQGDKLALSKLRCFPYDPTTCGNADGAWRTSVRSKGQQAAFNLKATGDRPARQITLIAAQVANPFERFIVLSWIRSREFWWWSPPHGSCGRDQGA